MNYTIHQLQVFITVVKTKSITKAAQELHLTQPAVSIQLKNFQDQFDIPLTEVVGRKLYITDFGLEIADAVSKIIDQIHAINYRTLSHQGKLIGKLKIAVVSTGKYVMPYFLSDFINQHSGIELNMDVTNRVRVIQSLENNEVDLALVSILPNHLNVESIDLLQNKLYLVGGNTLNTNHKSQPKNVFKTLPLIFREAGSGTRIQMEKFLNTHEINVLKKIELTSNEAVKQAILAGLGYSIMPLIGLRNELLKKEIQIIPVKGLPIITNWSLVWLRGKKHSPVVNAFIEYVNENKVQIAQQKFGWYGDIY
ncbi:MAG: LysR family transcriptional regulator [Saprospiraceae bacterium]